jgi:hypothetical protein
MSQEHSSFVRIARKPLTSQEAGWVRELVLSNIQWADVEIGELYVIAECRCGCRSVFLEAPPTMQNPKLAEHQGLVGDISLKIRFDGREDVVSVLLHFAKGSLSLLEVVWYNFPEPVPRSWVEISRSVSVGNF